jgi:hypothetical protein
MSHILETLLLLSLVVAAVLSVLPRRLVGSWPFKLAVVAVILTVVDIVLGNWRWQIVPAYTLSLILLAVTHYRGRGQSPPGWKRRILFIGGVVIGGVWLLMAVVLPIGYPMFESPAPSGPHGVGIMDIHLIDEARAEDMTTPVSFEINDFVYRQSKNVAYSLTVGGSTHGSYSDFGVMSRLGDWTGALGTIDGWAMKDLLNDYTLAFFNKHLKGTEEPLLDGPSDTHPDVLELIHRDGRATAENLMVVN